MRIFEKFSNNHRRQFDLMVKDEWNENFSEVEDKFSPNIFLGIEGDTAIAGVALFKKSAPETEYYLDFAEQLFSKKVYYLGYFVVSKNHRGCGIGTEFMKKFLKKFPKQKFWLAIENVALQRFYEKFGFNIIDEFNKEKILIKT